MNIAPMKTVVMALEEAGFKQPYAQSGGHALFLRPGGMLVDVFWEHCLVKLAFKWGETIRTETCSVAIEDGSEWAHVSHKPTGTLAEVEAVLKAFRDPGYVTALAGIEWASNLMQHLLKTS